MKVHFLMLVCLLWGFTALAQTLNQSSAPTGEVNIFTIGTTCTALNTRIEKEEPIILAPSGNVFAPCSTLTHSTTIISEEQIDLLPGVDIKNGFFDLYINPYNNPICQMSDQLNSSFFVTSRRTLRFSYNEYVKEQVELRYRLYDSNYNITNSATLVGDKSVHLGQNNYYLNIQSLEIGLYYMEIDDSNGIRWYLTFQKVNPQ